MYSYNSHAILPLILAIFVFILGMFVYIRNRKSIINSVFVLFCLCYTYIMFGTFMMFISTSSALAIYWDKFIYLGATLIPAFWYHLIVSFLKLKKKQRAIRMHYFICVCFLILSRTRYFLDDLYVYSWGVHSQARFFHNIFIICFALIVIRGLYDLRIGYSYTASSSQRNQLRYLSLGIFVVSLTSIGFLSAYNIGIYPLFYQIFGILFIVIIAYAIVKYRLMDIKLVLTRSSIFISVYTLVLGIPFWIGYITKNWLLSTSVAVGFATAGPSIYNYLRHRAENRILAEDLKKYTALTRFSADLLRLHDLDNICKLITYRLTKTMRSFLSALYLLDADKNAFLLKSSYKLKISQNTDINPLQSVEVNSSLVRFMKQWEKEFLVEDVQRLVLNKTTSLNEQDNHPDYFKEVVESMRKLGAVLVIPYFLEGELLGFLTLSEREHSRMYVQADLQVLSVLSRSATLAITNAIYLMQLEKTQN